MARDPLTTHEASFANPKDFIMLRSLRLSLLLLDAIGVLACFILAGQGLWVQMQLNRSASNAFVAKDVVADILPPPMYPIELRLVLSQAVEGTLGHEQAQREVDRLVGEYSERVAYWRKTPSPGVDNQLRGPQNDSAQAFIAAAQTQVMNRLRSGDLGGARAALPGVHQVFLAHLAMVRQTVAAGNKIAETSMATFMDVQTHAKHYAISAVLIAWALVSVVCRMVLDSARRPVEAMIRSMT
jgi:methyl-accepting chemotaxis protein